MQNSKVFTPTMKKCFLLLTVLLFLTSLPATYSQEEASETSDPLHFVVITPGKTEYAFWATIARGAYQAGVDLGVQVEYQAPDDPNDAWTVAKYINEALDAGVDGLVVSLHYPKEMASPIRRAIEAGIPVISINSGSDIYADLGILTHVGQSEYEAAYAAGEHLAEAGVTHGLCVNHDRGGGLDERCKGFADALALANGGQVSVLLIDDSQPDQMRERINMALDTMPDLNGILSLGGRPDLIFEVLRERALFDQIKVGVFDLDTSILEAIKAGEVLFAVDQQQYLQGYLPIVLLKLYIENASLPAEIIFPTGPGFVTAENAALVEDLVAEGTR